MENQKNSGGKALKIVTIVFAALIVTLIFLSKTIYTYNLPQVTGVMPARGKLFNAAYASGTTNYKTTVDLYSDTAGKISQVLASEGDFVEKDQPIFEIDFEGADEGIRKQMAQLEEEQAKRLDELSISRQKLNLDIEKINANIDNTMRLMEELKSETYKIDEVSDYEIVQCEKDIAKAEEDLAKLQTLFEAGTATQNEITNAERALDNLREKLENLKKTRNDNLARSAENLTDKEAARQKQLRSYQSQLDSYAQDIESKQLDLASNALQEKTYLSDYATKMADYNEKLKTYGETRIIRAPEDAVLTKLHINRGQRVNAGQQIASFGLTSEYIIECDIPQDNDFVLVGDRCKMNNQGRSITGVVTKITPAGMVKTVTLSIQDEDVTTGETFQISFEKQSAESYTLVPNGAVGKDAEGYYLNQLKRRSGILGNEYYTEKLRIYIGDSDSTNTAVTRGITFPEPVVLISDKPFSEGDTIKIRNEGDFFAD